MNHLAQNHLSQKMDCRLAENSIKPDTLTAVQNQVLANVLTLEKDLSEIIARLTGPKPEKDEKEPSMSSRGQLGVAMDLRTLTTRLNAMAEFILNEL